MEMDSGWRWRWTSGRNWFIHLDRWAESVQDYEILRRELPNNNDIAESLFHAQAALKKSRGVDVNNMKFGGEVELVTDLEQFKAAVASSGASVVLYKMSSDLQCKQISPFLDTLLDTEMETCQRDKSMLKRRLDASAVEIERQVLDVLY